MAVSPDLIDARTIHEIVWEMKRTGLYLRVSQDSQTTENQRRILMEVAERSGWTVVEVFEDAGFSGAKSRDKRPAVDTSTPSGRMLFQMLAVFSEFERAIITSRINAGLARARARGVTFGRPNLSLKVRQKVQKALADGHSIRQVAKITGVSSASVGRIKRSMATVEDRQESVAA